MSTNRKLYEFVMICCCAVYIISTLIKALGKKKEEQPLPISLTKCTVLWTALKPCSPYISNTKSLNNLQDFKRTRTHSQLMHMRILVPGYLSSKFVTRYETRYSLRDSVNKLLVPFPRANFMKNSFSYSGEVVWNSLPCDMREAKSF